MDPWQCQVRIISLQNFITCWTRSQRWTPSIFEFGASPVKSLRNCKKLQNRLSVPDLGSKNGLQILDFQRNSCLQRKCFFLLRKIRQNRFFFPLELQRGGVPCLNFELPDCIMQISSFLSLALPPRRIARGQKAQIKVVRWNFLSFEFWRR